ncbi:MAG: glycosyltransferase, partial [Desulfuromonas sp.]|nr:glycosyltransferase [Desulfuromonas sp.]
MTETAKKEVFISLVVPAYNEEEVIDSFYARTRAVLEKVSDRYEIIFVNDGSKDGTADK